MPRGRSPKSAAPDWALSIKMRRLSLGRGQEDIVAESDEELSQGWISDVERGKVDLRQAGFSKVVALAEALNWTLAEMQRAIGIDLGVPDEPEEPPKRYARGSPIPPVIDEIEDLPLQIPPALQEMINEYGGIYSELHNERTLRALSMPRLFAGHSQGPQTAEDWHDYFMMTRKWLPK